MLKRRERREPFINAAVPAWDYPRAIPEPGYGPGREPLDWNVRWPARQHEAFLRAGIGAGTELEFKAGPGHGPHILCVGAPGLGKTAILRTVLIGLADRYSPDRVQFAIAALDDQVPGAELPHVATVVARLAEPSPQPSPFPRAVDDELWRRRQLTDAALAEEPALVLLIDDVDRVLTARPEFAGVLDEIARTGERIGVHLLLSATDPAGLDTHRCLRVTLDGRGARLGDRRFRRAAYTPEHLLRFAYTFANYRHPVRSLWSPPDGLTVERMRAKDTTPGAGVAIGQATTGATYDPRPDRVEPPSLPATATIDFARRSHLLIIGAPGCGKTTALRTVLRGLSEQHTDDGAVVLDVGEAHAVKDRILAELERRANDQGAWSGPRLFLVADFKKTRRTHSYLEELEALLRLGRKIGVHLIATAETEPDEPVFHALADHDVTRIRLSGNEAHEQRWDTVDSRFAVHPGSPVLTRTPVGRATLIADDRREIQIAVDTEATFRPPRFRPPEDLFTAADPAWTAPLTAAIGTTPEGEPFHLDIRGHVWCGGAGTDALLRKIAFDLATRHSPAELQFVTAEIGSDALADTASLPHNARHAVLADPQDMHRLSALLDQELRRRLALEQDGGLADEPRLVVFVHQAGDPDAVAPALAETLERIAAIGGRLRVWLVLAETSRPGWEHRGVHRLAFNRVSLGHSRPVDVEKRLRGTDIDFMLWYDGRRHLFKSTDAVRVGYEDDVFLFHHCDATPEEIHNAHTRWEGAAPPLGRTDGLLTYSDILWVGLLFPKRDSPVPLGVIEPDPAGSDRRRPFGLDFDERPHFVVAGPEGSGRSTVLRTVLSSIATRYTPERAAVVLLHDDDLAGAIPDEYVLARSSGFATPEQLIDVLRSLRRRIEHPGPDDQQVFIVMDDYERFDTEHQPLLALRDIVPHAAAIRLHLVLSGGPGILGRKDVFSLQAPQLVIRDAPVPGSTLGSLPPLTGVGRGVFSPGEVQLRLPWNGLVAPDPPPDQPAPRPVGLAELLRFQPEEFRPDLDWRDKSEQEYLRAAIGFTTDGARLLLDLKGSKRDGMGPNGMLIGSDRQEVLRTVIASLAGTHTPDEVNLLLGAYNDSGTFAGLDVLPHVAAVVTGLAGQADLMDRLADAIEGELVRRREVLRATGGFTDRWEYEQARKAGQPLDPMPTLLIVIDDFCELLAAKSDFINLLIQAARGSYSLGVHLLLGSERLLPGTLKGMDGFLSYRIALRLSSAEESRTVIGSAAAYKLPPEPGHGYLQVGTQEPVRFRTVDQGAEHEPGADVGSALRALAARAAGKGRPAYRMWLPPLAEPPTLDQLMPWLKAYPDRGLSPTGFAPEGRLLAAVGEEDRPFEHRRVACLVDLSGDQGSVAIAGEPKSGKSNLLCAMIGSMALMYTPREVQFFCLDFGGGTLRGLEELPHVAGVFGRQEEEGVRRTIQEVDTILDEREAFFTENKIESMGSYRSMKEQGRFADDPYGDVFLVIDNWMTLREGFEPFVDQARAIGNRGLAYGVHVLVTCTRWGDIRMNMRDMFGLKLELKLSDDTESEIDRKAAVNVPKNRPGRGLSPSKLHFLAAVPRIDAIRDGDDFQPGVEDFVTKVKQAWPHPPCPRLRTA